MSWLTLKTMRGTPIRVGGLTVTPSARLLSLSVPGRPVGLMWARPGPVEVAWDSGVKQWVEVRDVTREVLIGVWALCAAAGVCVWLARRTAR